MFPKTTSLYYSGGGNYSITSINPQGESKIVVYDDINDLPTEVIEGG